MPLRLLPKTLNNLDRRWKVKIGTQNLNSTAKKGIILDILEISIHPEYDNESSYYDVAVLTVRLTEVSFGRA